MQCAVDAMCCCEKNSCFGGLVRQVALTLEVSIVYWHNSKIGAPRALIDNKDIYNYHGNCLWCAWSLARSRVDAQVCVSSLLCSTAVGLNGLRTRVAAQEYCTRLT